ncbi:Protein N-acetyltransferase, RimJ/RimL family [Pricia antarctica]|uniref:Protein N-acetyltransferase, RimJ/RimL family n=1 Tax=Pricia antarctica TaxID=641691 RepID=A0A1G6VRC1_9FLAO|nr:GNAT family protein [Pricia antarctica]SDD56084.1 Protein N-acetyltransferase, RimJ/RimL family [Pricia antarctica]
MKNWLKTIELEGQKVKLVPLQKSHKAGLLKAAADGKLWELWFTSVPSSSNIDKYIEHALNQKQNGSEFPFVVLDKNKGDIIGSTRYLNMQSEHRRLEIGSTWYAKKHQRTGVNTECKYLLLKYAFENLNCIAVQFMTDWHNSRSRTAIARLGAKQDGVLRNHRLNADGSCRDSVVFSITEQEWAAVKKSLRYEMEKYHDEL